MGVIEQAKARLACSPYQIGFTSFTRAARAEASARAAAMWSVPPESLEADGWFRTVHSIAHRQLGVRKGQIIDRSKESVQWLAEVLNVRVHTIIDDDSGHCTYGGDKTTADALNIWSVSRSRLEPLCDTIARRRRLGEGNLDFGSISRVVAQYEAAKRLHDKCDFTDLLCRFAGVRFTTDGMEDATPEGKDPEGVLVWVFDEHQDASALINACCWRLANGPGVEWVYLAGDPEQSIFSFMGSDADHFLEWPADREKVMPQSWRCPPAVHKLGEAALKRKRRGYVDRGIQPASHDGKVVRAFAEQAIAMIDPTEDTLVLARCHYITEKYEEMLAQAKIPFARLKASDATQALRACNALWNLEHNEPVDADDFALAVSLLPAKDHLVRGTKAIWSDEKRRPIEEVIFPADMEAAGFLPALIEKVREGKWADLFSGAGRWRAAAVRYGADLATSPKIRTGTVHASKGMEADTVVLSTTVTRKIFEAQSLDADQHDEERRIEYVAVTRARKRLILTSEADAEYKMQGVA